MTREVEVAILGAGVCGIGAGITLKRDGIDDFVIFERAGELGGTWHHNTYPGCAVDIPSHLYSYSFAMNPDWRRTFAEQPELKRYVADTAERFGIPAHVRLRTEVLDARWDERAQRWAIETSDGPYAARFFIVAAGPLHEPEIPDVPGMTSFRGEMFHSSRWRHDVDLTGRRVAVIGNGASALQFVPAIQPLVERLTVFQRTPSWVVPKIDWRTTRLERWAMRHIPGLMRFARWLEWAPIDLLITTLRHPRLARLAHGVARWNVRRAIRDPELRRKVTPRYVIGCKRTGISNSYYPALAQPNVELVAAAVEEIRPGSVISADGAEHAVDAIIFGTGFKVLTDHPVAERIRGRTGATLAEYWNGSPRAYNGTVITGFPNMFMLFGPNIGTASGFVMAEAQLQYIAGALGAVRAAGLASIDVREDAQRAFVGEMDRAFAGSVFTAGGCTSYYLDRTGRVALAWPWTMAGLRRRLRTFDLAAFEARQPSEASPVGIAAPSGSARF
ncbi:MAG TPA: NAD(P)/FAD-dependent oxidoreductase [Solirubrobacteraceae bacterium]|nr:NAD(P)/FAD-dependent oxidoreductase [Solirubrobacteraceae bacterium]